MEVSAFWQISVLSACSRMAVKDPMTIWKLYGIFHSSLQEKSIRLINHSTCACFWNLSGTNKCMISLPQNSWKLLEMFQCDISLIQMQVLFFTLIVILVVCIQPYLLEMFQIASKSRFIILKSTLIVLTRSITNTLINQRKQER